MVRVFISYRREDSAGQAGRICDRLAAHYSPESVFMDVARIEPGADFAEAIGVAVSRCNVMLAVVGRKWAGGEKPSGRRLDEPHDFVRLEIAAALKRNISVLFVLINDAAKPTKEDLPQDIAGLAVSQAIELRESRWEEDVARLMEVLERVTGSFARVEKRWHQEQQRTLLLLIAAVATLLVIGGRNIHLSGGQPNLASKDAVRAVTSLSPSATVPALATRAMATLSDGRVVSASVKGIVIWDPVAPAEAPVMQIADDDAMSIAVLQGGLWAWGTRSGSINLWNAERREFKATLTGHTSAVSALASMDDGRLASGSWDGTVRIWDPATGKLDKTLAGHTSQVRALAALGNGRLASGSTDGTIIVWNLAGSTESSKTFNRRGDTINALAKLPDQRVAAGSENGTIEIWNWATGNLETSLRAHTDWINVLVVLGDARVVSASDDLTIGVWDPAKNLLDARLEGHTRRITALAILSDGRLVSGSEDGTIRLWQGLPRK